MKQLRQVLVKKILKAKDKAEVDAIIQDAIALLREYLISEFVIALFIHKLTMELEEIKGNDDKELLDHIRHLHPGGLQWQF
jgi:hypothetical protein